MLYWHFIHIYVLHMSNVHQYIWWQVGVRWFFYENWIICTFCAFGVIYGFGEKSDKFCLPSFVKDFLARAEEESLQIGKDLFFLNKKVYKLAKMKVYKLAKIFSVWPAAVPGGWSNRLGSWNWQQNSFWDFQSLTCLTTEQTSRLTWTK